MRSKVSGSVTQQYPQPEAPKEPEIVVKQRSARTAAEADPRRGGEGDPDRDPRERGGDRDRGFLRVYSPSLRSGTFMIGSARSISLVKIRSLRL